MSTVAVANTTTALSGKTLMIAETDVTITGLQSFSRSTNAPFAVNSGAAKVDNLDADKLDGQTGTYYTNASNLDSGTVPTARLPALGWTLLGQGSGTDATASATNVFTLAISGLTVKDRLKILITHSSAAQLTNAPVLYSTTDSANIKGLCNNGNLAASDYGEDEITLSNDQSSTTKVIARDVGWVGTTASSGHNTGIVWTPSTAWTGSWTLALRTGAGGVTAGGTYRYNIAVYKVVGQ